MATVINFATGVPRITNKGLLVEEARTNLAPNSEDLTAASYNATNLTVTANQAVAPNGATTADRLNEGVGTGAHSLSQPFTSVSGQSNTVSVFVHGGTRRYAQLLFGSGGHGSTAYANFDLQAGTVGTVGAGASATITAIGAGFYRITLTAPATASTASASAQLLAITSSTAARAENYTGTSLYLDAFGFQIEGNASFATSYIPTTGVSATRGADDPRASYSMASGQDFIVSGEVELTKDITTVNRLLFEWTDGTSNNRFRLEQSVAQNVFMTVVVGGSATTSTNVAKAGARVMSWSISRVGSVYTLTVDGVVIGTVNVAAMPTLTTIFIGQNSGTASFLNDYVRRFKVDRT